VAMREGRLPAFGVKMRVRKAFPELKKL